VVVDALKKALKDKRPHGLTFVKLFFDCECEGQGAKHPCSFCHTTVFADHEEFLKAHQI
jgi:hypothetical protein